METPEKDQERDGCMTGVTWLGAAEKRFVATNDGVRLAYEVLGPRGHTLLLANGLGGRLYAWQPIIEAFAATHHIVTWDYRGLFDSTTPAHLADLDIHSHASDAAAVLDDDDISSAIVIGWSMGVQVALELAVRYPERVKGLILCNGTHGHALETAFQPWFRVPSIGRLLHRLIELLIINQSLRNPISAIARSRLLLKIIGKGWGWFRQRQEIEQLACQYATDVFGPSFENYLRLFQELDAHSAYHHLHDLDQPTLVISGGLDVLTPSYQSDEIIRKMPNAQRVHLPLATHLILAEYPGRIMPAIERFVAEIDPI